MSGCAASNLAMNPSYQSPCAPGLPWVQSWSRIVPRCPVAAGFVAACGAAVGAAAAAGAVVAAGAAGLVVAAGAAGAVVATAGAGEAPPPQAARIAAPGIVPSTSAAPRNI